MFICCVACQKIAYARKSRKQKETSQLARPLKDEDDLGSQSAVPYA